ncbi:MAG TPA: DNA-binding protein [Candidatus Angelobacter sp.]|nr:DNA-binding protein [Candidatus Angelobacter sp.]
MRKSAILVVIVILALMTPAEAGNLTAAEARNHIGESATVCGEVTSVHFAAGSKGTPTFVNLDKAYPNHIFTILIWGDDLPNFNELPTRWEGKKACATGMINLYGGVPEIVAKTQDQITIKK